MIMEGIFGCQDKFSDNDAETLEPERFGHGAPSDLISDWWTLFSSFGDAERPTQTPE